MIIFAYICKSASKIDENMVYLNCEKDSNTHQGDEPNDGPRHSCIELISR